MDFVYKVHFLDFCCRIRGGYMSVWELFFISLALSMDAFAVAVCKGLAMPRFHKAKAVIIACWFGAFQALMPLIGYFLGIHFSSFVKSIDHWIAFGLLSYIGYGMIKESREGCDVHASAELAPKLMLGLALATSIDALSVGITFAFLSVRILPAVCCIGSVTFLSSLIGAGIGRFFGAQLKAKSELFGGLILIGMGFKILISHLFF